VRHAVAVTSGTRHFILLWARLGQVRARR
jgi:hypothetical protein